MRKKRIYLDYAASTPVDKKALLAMMPYLKGEFGNPSSVHSFGQKARAAVEKAREQVASFLSCSANEIVFTSGASEANNLAIQGVLPRPSLGVPRLGLGTKPHVITSSIEHESVLAPIEELERKGVIEASYISVGKEGIVNPAEVEKAIKKNTILVSIQYANSEIGTVQPIAELGKIIQNCKLQTTNYKLLFHTDAVQATPYLSCNTEKLRVDMLTLSSHKLYGPKGVGALYIKKGTPLSPLLRGGGQEQDFRSGTENVPGIVGMGEAIQEIWNPKSEIRNITIRQLRDTLVKNVVQRVPGSRLTGSKEHRLPNNAHFLFEGVEGKDVVLLLDQKGIAASAGSACSELTQEPSHVLLAMGYSGKEALSALRLTLGKHTKKEDVEKTARALGKVLDQLRGGQ